MILDGGQSSIGVESTIIDLTDKKVKILRHGYISSSDIEKVLNCKITTIKYKKIFKSPGLSIDHYQPDKPVRINAKKQKVNEGWLGFGKISNNFAKPSLSLSKKMS